MAKIPKIVNGQAGLTARLAINTAIQSVETDGTISGNGNIGTPLSVAATLASYQTSLGFSPQDAAEKNQSDGYAGLDSEGKINPLQLPPIQLTNAPVVLADEDAMIALNAVISDVVVRTDSSQTFILSALPASELSNWTQLLFPTAGGVHSVFGRIGAVTPQSNDYTWSQINKTVSSLSDFTDKGHDLLSGVGSYSHAQIDAHITNISNPHEVTAAQVGAASEIVLNAHITETDIHFVIDDVAAAANKVYSSQKTDASLNTKLGTETFNSHADNANIHFVINDSLASATSVYSSEKTASLFGDINAHIVETSIHFVINDVTPLANAVYSSEKVSSLNSALNTLINDHANDTSRHFLINDLSVGASSVFSSSKVQSELVLKSDLSLLNTHTENTGIHFAINDSTPSLTAVYSSQKTVDLIAEQSGNLTSHVNNADIHFTIDDATPAANKVFSSNKVVSGLSEKLNAATFNEHTENAAIHFVIDDSIVAATSVYSSTKIASELALKLSASTLDAHNNDTTIHYTINDATATAEQPFSGQKVAALIDALDAEIDEVNRRIYLWSGL